MTNLERYQVLTQPYIRNQEIMALTGLCRHKVSDLISVIIDKATKQGKTLLYARGHIPSKMLIEHLGLDLNELYELALKEKQLGIV